MKSSNFNGLKVMIKIKVFVYAANADTDGRAMTLALQTFVPARQKIISQEKFVFNIEVKRLLMVATCKVLKSKTHMLNMKSPPLILHTLGSVSIFYTYLKFSAKYFTRSFPPWTYKISCLYQISYSAAETILNIYTPMAFASDEVYENCGNYFPMTATGHVTENWHLFLYLFGVICHFSMHVNIWIEVHFFVLIGKWHWFMRKCLRSTLRFTK